MPDAFEWFFFLDPSDPADALLDHDGDGLLNVREAVLGADPFAEDTDADMIPDDLDATPVSRFFLQFGSPFFTDGDRYDYAKPNYYFLGAWKDGGEWFSTIDPRAGRMVRNTGELSTQSGWHAASVESNVVESLNVALDRTILTNNLVYAIHCWDAGTDASNATASLYVNLLAANGDVVFENLYGNLMEGSNVETVVYLDVPTAYFTNAAVIQLRRGTGDVTIWEGMIYIDEDFDGLDADAEKSLNTSDYNADSNGNGVSDYAEFFGQTTNNVVPIEPKKPKPPDGDDPGKPTGVIYVDQARGNDSLTGRAPVVSGEDGPKKTVGKGMTAVDEDRAHTMVIKSGAYHENLDIRGKAVTVVIEGNVRL